MSERKWSGEEDAQLLNLLRAGRSLREISLEMGRTKGSVAGAKFRLENCAHLEIDDATRHAFSIFLERHWRENLPKTLLDLWNRKYGPEAGLGQVNFPLMKYLLEKNEWKLTAEKRKELEKKRLAGFNERSLPTRAKAQERLKEAIIASRDHYRKTPQQVSWRECCDCHEELPLVDECFRKTKGKYFSQRCLWCAGRYRRLKHNVPNVKMLELGKVMIAIHKTRRAPWERKIEQKERDILVERMLFLEEHPGIEMILCPDCAVEPKTWPKVKQFVPELEDCHYLCRICLNRRKRKAGRQRRIRSEEGEE